MKQVITETKTSDSSNWKERYKGKRRTNVGWLTLFVCRTPPTLLLKTNWYTRVVGVKAINANFPNCKLALIWLAKRIMPINFLNRALTHNIAVYIFCLIILRPNLIHLSVVELKGDSGGPVWRYVMGRAVQIGVHVSASTDSKDDTTGCYTHGAAMNVPYYMNWIINTIKNN